MDQKWKKCNLIIFEGRISVGKLLTGIDLFAGAGGLSYGFEKAGFDICLAVEKDTWACDTYKLNHKNKNIIEGDITQLPDDLFAAYNGKIDVIMGGPPCQGFSIAASNRRKSDDARNTLYRQFLRVVGIVNPKIVLIENVKEIEKFKLPDGTRIVDDIKQFLADLGYTFDCAVIDCRKYGIPQDRRRFFFLAIKKDMLQEAIVLSTLLDKYIVPEISFWDAISDLPEVRPKQYAEDAVISYDKQPQNEYQARLRGSCTQISNHIPMQHTEKTIEKFKFLLANQNSQLPDELKPRMRGNLDKISKSSYSQNHRIIDKNKVSPTITASFYSSFIHPTQPRNLTVREAARIQTFPDSFVFLGKKTTLSKKLLAKKGIIAELHLDQFNQVGNAVPPLMAEHLAEICKALLERG